MKGREEERQASTSLIVSHGLLSCPTSSAFVTVYDSVSVPLLSVRYHGAFSLRVPLLTDCTCGAADDRLTVTIVPEQTALSDDCL
jgi:hypothetical protein